MRKKLLIVVPVIILIGIIIFVVRGKNAAPDKLPTTYEPGKIISGSFDKEKSKSDAEWKKILTPQQYYILRQAGTEAPFTGELNSEKRSGTYYSFGCKEALFRSEQKYDSGTGWPSFWAPISDDAVVLREEPSPDDRIEVLDKCGGHLGHIFDDGPPPSGKRYCMNSGALYFVPDKEDEL